MSERVRAPAGKLIHGPQVRGGPMRVPGGA